MNASWLLKPGPRSCTLSAGIVLSLLSVLAALAPPPACAQAIRSQTLQLAPGWNAVYLEVDPLVANPAELLASQPVDIVAAYDPPPSGAQFVSNPEANMLGVFGWGVWYSPRRPDAFLSRLYRLKGASAYLFHATTNATVEILGRLPPRRLQWLPDAYNLVGFPVQDPGAPTFQQFFQASPAHNHNKIYRLTNGTWRQVLDPSAAVMRSGEAFWIYCDGHSDYPGPLQVDAPSFFGVMLTSQSGGELMFRNRTSHPVAFTVEHIVDHNSPVPLSVAVRTVDEAAGGFRTVTVPFDAGHWEQPFPPLEAGEGLRLPLELRLSDAQAGVCHSILKIKSDMGTCDYIGITATRDDLTASRD